MGRSQRLSRPLSVGVRPLCVMKKKARPEHDLAFLGEIAPIESTGYSIYFPVGAGAGATTSLCCAQAPSSKAVTRTAMIMIIFRNFNLSRLLSSQVTSFRLGGDPRRSNAFLHFFEPSQIGRPGLFCVARRCLRLWSLLPSFAAHKLPIPRQLDC